MRKEDHEAVVLEDAEVRQGFPRAVERSLPDADAYEAPVDEHDDEVGDGGAKTARTFNDQPHFKII